eukprot:CAMPEP_0116131232 /NCGR_PEP_ID=MMETSP0329-20121206/8898_1 /TAXON_ID=697910 /ORGANISM="Pseudo-nitzschia arenysensis, Strain B593" /LENGTH=300 /DNA_ID=CAMNT_0003625653 /DNA_START=15 /DNA_END=916 /DNA_ORIENTATION=-
MFRKPKRKKQAGLRKKRAAEDDDDEADQEATREALKRAKQEHGGSVKTSSLVEETTKRKVDKNLLLHNFEISGNAVSQKDLATATVQYHPKEMEEISKSKPDPKRNKFLAGPIRAPTNIRTTCRFDYQPDVCKDYKDTGFCGFGDTCIYLHDRGDTMSGWQLEKAWEEKQKSKRKQQEEQMERFLNGETEDSNKKNKKDLAALSDDGLPFACFLSREAFEDPIVTTCGHYFSQQKLLDYFALNDGDQRCPICKKNTHGVMNQPTKLIAKKRKMLGRKATWQEFFDARRGIGAIEDGNDDE